jgi:hypothetical protein
MALLTPSSHLSSDYQEHLFTEAGLMIAFVIVQALLSYRTSTCSFNVARCRLTHGI